MAECPPRPWWYDDDEEENELKLQIINIATRRYREDTHALEVSVDGWSLEEPGSGAMYRATLSHSPGYGMHYQPGGRSPNVTLIHGDCCNTSIAALEDLLEKTTSKVDVKSPKPAEPSDDTADIRQQIMTNASSIADHENLKIITLSDRPPYISAAVVERNGDELARGDAKKTFREALEALLVATSIELSEKSKPSISPKPWEFPTGELPPPYIRRGWRGSDLYDEAY